LLPPLLRAREKAGAARDGSAFAKASVDKARPYLSATRLRIAGRDLAFAETQHDACSNFKMSKNADGDKRHRINAFTQDRKAIINAMNVVRITEKVWRA
jgi:hypothetical protein